MDLQLGLVHADGRAASLHVAQLVLLDALFRHSSVLYIQPGLHVHTTILFEIGYFFSWYCHVFFFVFMPFNFILTISIVVFTILRISFASCFDFTGNRLAALRKSETIVRYYSINSFIQYIVPDSHSSVPIFFVNGRIFRCTYV